MRERLRRPDELACSSCGTATDGKECSGRMYEEHSFWCPACAPVQNRVVPLRGGASHQPFTYTPAPGQDNAQVLLRAGTVVQDYESYVDFRDRDEVKSPLVTRPKAASK